MDKVIVLRPATVDDASAIRSLIHQVGINPMSLDWHRFTVAVSGSRLIACGQIKPVPGDLYELASIAVIPDHRHQGIARAIIQHLLSDSPRPLYLTCRSSLGSFYERFGFMILERSGMPKYYLRLARLASVFLGIKGGGETLLVMRLR